MKTAQRLSRIGASILRYLSSQCLHLSSWVEILFYVTTCTPIVAPIELYRHESVRSGETQLLSETFDFINADLQINRYRWLYIKNHSRKASTKLVIHWQYCFLYIKCSGELYLSESSKWAREVPKDRNRENGHHPLVQHLKKIRKVHILKSWITRKINSPNK